MTIWRFPLCWLYDGSPPLFLSAQLSIKTKIPHLLMQLYFYTYMLRISLIYVSMIRKYWLLHCTLWENKHKQQTAFESNTTNNNVIATITMCQLQVILSNNRYWCVCMCAGWCYSLTLVMICINCLSFPANKKDLQ